MNRSGLNDTAGLLAWLRPAWGGQGGVPAFAALVVAIVAAAAAAIRAILGGPDPGPYGFPLVIIPAAVAAALAWRCAACFDLSSGCKRAWRWVALAVLVIVLATAAGHAAGALGMPMLSRMARVAGMLAFPVAAVACVLLRRSDGGAPRGSGVWLDGLAVSLGAGAFAWFFLLEPLAASAAGGGIDAQLRLAHQGLACVALVAVALAGSRRWEGARRIAQPWLLIGLAMLLAARLIGEFDVPWGAALSVGVQALGAALVAAAAQLEHVVASAVEPVRVDRVATLPRIRPMPVLGLALATVTLFYLQRDAWLEPAGLMTLVACLSFVMVLGGQALSAREVAGRQAQQAVEAAEQRFAALVRNSSDVLAITATDGRFIYVTPSAERVFGLTAPALLGKRATEMVALEDRVKLQTFLHESLAKAGSAETIELRIARGGDRVRVVEVVGTNLAHEPDVGGLVLSIRDITERKGLEEQLRRLAFHDPLTLLANRALFRDRVEHALARRSSTTVAAIFVDLDNFKKINDSLGHGVGDKVLRTTAQRLTKCTRAGDTVARLGGDEFALLIEDAADREQIFAVAARIVSSVKEPFPFSGSNLGLAASVGVAFAEDSDGVEELLRNADIAMYEAKAAGKSRFEVFEPRMQTEVRDRFKVETDLNRAISRNELRVFFQPIVDLESGYLLGVEALVRWMHPERGLILPADFIPVAEETGQVVGLGRWVLKEACGAMREWQKRMPVGDELRLAVNVSVQQVQREDFVSSVMAALTASGLEPGCLVIEMTEGVVMQDTEATFEKLSQLKRHGVRIAIDDFGTGYSSLSYLHRFPIDILKIDRSFVHRLGDQRGGTELARAIITLGATLGLEVVAEGIEQEQQKRELLELGCVAGQGYYYSRPGTLKEIEISHHMQLRRSYGEELPADVRFTATGRFTTSDLLEAPVDKSATGTFGI